jgi:hypothetical protein
VSIPDDHDVGHPNLWGANGKSFPGSPPDRTAVTTILRTTSKWLSDARRGICRTQSIQHRWNKASESTSRLCEWGGVDFAVLEDRKFKTGPEGTIPQLGPRPDHITDPSYDRAAIDLPNLQLLGDRPSKFLNQWSQDWTGAEMQCVLSQTAFCGAVHLHGSRDNRLLADLDCNGWPQSGRRAALREIRRAWAPHLCGDQHLAVVVKHGIDASGDGPYGFTSPTLSSIRSTAAGGIQKMKRPAQMRISRQSAAVDRRLRRWTRKSDIDAGVCESRRSDP